MLKIVHFLNQFFAGLGGEDHAEVGPQVRDGLVGPGMAIQKAMGDQGTIIATIVCGDNYFAENIETATNQVMELITPLKPDLVLAGPAFNAGRYGISCGAVCQAVNKRLNLPAVTAMHEENPGLDLYRQDAYILPTEDSIKGMNAATKAMVAFWFETGSRAAYRAAVNGRIFSTRPAGQRNGRTQRRRTQHCHASAKS